jgi:hypothetical protein
MAGADDATDVTGTASAMTGADDESARGAADAAADVRA